MFSFVLILTTLRQDSSLSAMLCQHTVLRTSAHQVLMRCVTGCYPTAMPNCTIEVPIDFSVEHQEDVVSSPCHCGPMHGMAMGQEQPPTLPPIVDNVLGLGLWY